MRRLLRRLWSDERGVSLVIIALTMTTLVSLLAFSVDLGLVYAARTEAQRAADAAALAGATAFLNFPEGDAGIENAASVRAARYVAANPIRGMPGELADIQVSDTDPRFVRLTVRREAVPLSFAPLLGIQTVVVTASATAGAVPADRADCVAPLAFDHEALLGRGIDEFWESTHAQPVSIVPRGEGDGPGRFEYIMAEPTAARPGLLNGWHNDPGGCRSGQIPIGDVLQQPAPGEPLPPNWAHELAEGPSCDELVDGDGWNGSRIITVMLYSESENAPRVIQDFLLFCVDRVVEETVEGQFLAYASGMGEGPSETALTLQLVE